MNRKSTGFSLIEILLALVFVSFAFLPIYNLFRVGNVGAMSNVREVEATNYASDLINFLREMDFSEVENALGGDSSADLKNDEEIKAKFPNWTLTVGKDFERSLHLQKFKGNKAGLGGLTGLVDNIIHHRRSVPNYLAEVKVVFKKAVGANPDEVKLSTIIMD